jgi:hypothetical protein
MLDKLHLSDDEKKKIKNNQTHELLTKYKESSRNDSKAVQSLEKALLITSENIHLNSFMYEPILDMGEQGLKGLYDIISELLPKEKANIN